MKAKLVWLAVGSMLLGGCEAVSDMRTAVQERAVPRAEARTKTFPGSPRLVYEAVRAAAGQMGYRFVRGGPAQGEFDAVSNVDVGETRSSARQLALKVRLNPTLDGTSTEVIVTLTERGGRFRRDADKAMAQLTRRYEKDLGAAAVADLHETLRRLIGVAGKIADASEKK